VDPIATCARGAEIWRGVKFFARAVGFGDQRRVQISVFKNHSLTIEQPKNLNSQNFTTLFSMEFVKNVKIAGIIFTGTYNYRKPILRCKRHE
jgi:hypothetical protein